MVAEANGKARMLVVVTGSSGLLGSALVAALQAEGNQVIRLVRRLPQSADETQWNPLGAPDPAPFEGADAVVHLAGESVAGRWTKAKKSRIHNTRVQSTQVIASAIARAKQPPRTLVSASAIGYYPIRSESVQTEDSPSGSGFFPDLVRQWESANEPARAAGVRVVMARMGVVLSRKGGALAKMLPAFRFGLAGRIGSGRQWMSWISIYDVVGAFKFALANAGLNGPVNFVAPNPVTNAEFTRTLAQVVHRPAVFPVPEFVVKLAFGEMGDTLLLGSQRVLPAKLQAAGFRFQYPQLRAALEAVLNPPTGATA